MEPEELKGLRLQFIQPLGGKHDVLRKTTVQDGVLDLLKGRVNGVKGRHCGLGGWNINGREDQQEKNNRHPFTHKMPLGV